MKFIKKFENFGDQDFGPRFSGDEDETEPVNPSRTSDEDEEDCAPCSSGTTEYSDEDDLKPEERGEFSEEDEEEVRTWGDEGRYVESISSFKNFINEKKATPAQLAARKAFAEKAKGKADKKDDKTKKEVSYKKSGLKNPEKADLDKNKKISGYEKARGKAVQDAIEDEKKENGSKGLTAAQKKLPEGLRKAIEAKNKKK